MLRKLGSSAILTSKEQINQMLCTSSRVMEKAKDYHIVYEHNNRTLNQTSNKGDIVIIYCHC